MVICCTNQMLKYYNYVSYSTMWVILTIIQKFGQQSGCQQMETFLFCREVQTWETFIQDS